MIWYRDTQIGWVLGNSWRTFVFFESLLRPLFNPTKIMFLLMCDLTEGLINIRKFALYPLLSALQCATFTTSWTTTTSWPLLSTILSIIFMLSIWILNPQIPPTKLELARKKCCDQENLTKIRWKGSNHIKSWICHCYILELYRIYL